MDDATLAAADGDFDAAEEHLRIATQLFDELGVMPDPDDDAELGRLRERLAHRR